MHGYAEFAQSTRYGPLPRTADCGFAAQAEAATHLAGDFEGVAASGAG